MAHILVVDDDRAVCKSLELLLSKNGHKVSVVNLPVLVLDSIEELRPDLILLDMNFTIDTSGKQGMRLLQQILSAHPSMPVILMTGWGTLQMAVVGMKLGAKDFLTKPWDNKHMIESVRTALALFGHNDASNTQSEESDASIVGSAVAFQHVLEIVDKVASTNASVLITGESGTGKEVIAEAIHNRSKRKHHDFIKVNLGGISTSLFESEMFGHTKGSFTDARADRVGRFALADGGTIFLDEIGDLALESQVKLLRVLQEKTFEMLGSSRAQKTDVRVISATNKSLEDMVAKGTFREDLFYRINLIHIRVPSLSERREDISLLVDYFIRKTAVSYGIDPPIIEVEAMRWLQEQDYPGNIRQLRNLVERTTLLSSSRVLNVRSFQEYFKPQQHRMGRIQSPEIGTVTLEEMERHMIRKAYHFHNHSVSKTARSLGITRSSLYRRMEKYGIK